MQPRILIADDQADILSALKLLLKREGYDIATATSPAGVLDVGARLGELGGDAVVVGLEQGDRAAGRGLLHPAEDAGDLLGRHDAVDDTQLEELFGEELGLFVGGHGEKG